MIMCNRGETGVLGGAPGCPPTRAWLTSPRLACTCAAAPVHGDRAVSLPETCQDQARSEREYRSSGTRSTLLPPEQSLTLPVVPGLTCSSSRHCRWCRGSTAAAPGGCSWRAAARPAPPAQLSLPAHRSHTDPAYAALAGIPSSPSSPVATKGFGTGGRTRHKLGCRARGRGQAGEDTSPQQHLPELRAPPEPCRHRSIRGGDPHAAGTVHWGDHATLEADPSAAASGAGGQLPSPHRRQGLGGLERGWQGLLLEEGLQGASSLVHPESHGGGLEGTGHLRVSQPAPLSCGT